MVLNQTILDHYHNYLLRGSIWTAKDRKKMREKYCVAMEQHVSMEPPTLKVEFDLTSPHLMMTFSFGDQALLGN